MHHTTLVFTGLRVSVASLGTGGFSHLSLKAGKSEDEAARLIHEAIGLGISFIDAALSYGTEGAVGNALKQSRGPATKTFVATTHSDCQRPPRGLAHIPPSR